MPFCMEIILNKFICNKYLVMRFRGCLKVCQLCKAIYGLKQSPWAWFEKFKFIIGCFSHSTLDHFVLLLHSSIGFVILSQC